jgi:hypothetical protein
VTGGCHACDFGRRSAGPRRAHPVKPARRHSIRATREVQLVQARPPSAHHDGSGARPDCHVRRGLRFGGRFKAKRPGPDRHYQPRPHPTVHFVGGGTVIEPVYDDATGTLVYLSTPDNTPVHPNGHNVALIYLPVYPAVTADRAPRARASCGERLPDGNCPGLTSSGSIARPLLRRGLVLSGEPEPRRAGRSAGLPVGRVMIPGTHA